MAVAAPAPRGAVRRWGHVAHTRERGGWRAERSRWFDVTLPDGGRACACPPLDDTQVDYLDMLEYSADMRFRMVHEVLDFSEIEAGRIVLSDEVSDVERLVDTICRTVRVQVDENAVSFGWRVDSGCTRLRASLPLVVLQDSAPPVRRS